jgi:hypothetical protein
MNFKKKRQFISIVVDETLNFMEINTRGDITGMESIDLKSLLIDEIRAKTISASGNTHVHTLLIVPDYWFGNTSYRFQSRKKSWANAFIERKLQEQFPDQPEIRHFFDGNFYQREQAEGWIYAYFLSTPQFFQLYQCLVQLNLEPHRITCPAFIWQHKLRQAIPEFNKGAKGFVQLLPGTGLLYFFFEGNFLFSRSIPLGDNPTASSENINPIAYELNQSLYLFSQKTKAEIDQLYLLSFENECRQGLSEALGRPLDDVNNLINRSQNPQELGAAADLLGLMSTRDILPANDFLTLSHRVLKKELEWKPVQFAGIAIGLLLFCLLGFETLFLNSWSHGLRLPGANQAGIVATADRPDIQAYNQALNFLLAEFEKPLPQEALTKLAQALPPNVNISEIELEVENNPYLDFKGVIRAQGPEHFKETLSLLIANLNQNMQGRRMLTVPDIDFEVDQNRLDAEAQNYLVKFRLDL